MRYILRWSIVSVGVLLLIGLTTTATFAQDPDNGKALWEGQVWQCSMCHGKMGEGVFAKPLAGDTSLTAQDYINQVRSPRNQMPSFSEAQVTDEQLTDINAYLTSLPVPAENGFIRIELPDDAPEGQKLIVEKRCVACHTETGPVNRFIERGETPTAERVIMQLRNPFKNMPTFSEAKVSDEEATAIAEFLAEEFAAPAELPQSGHSRPSQWPLILLVVGGLTVLGGVVARRIVPRV